MTVCKLYLRIRIKKVSVEEQIQQVLSYIQGGLADIWKENVLEDQKIREVEFESAREFLLELRKEFGEGNEKSVRVAELKKVEQEERTIEEFVQEFRRIARGSEYERRVLVEEFERGMNGVIRRKLMEIKRPPISIEQQYEYITNLDKHWGKSKREEERLKRERENRNQGQRQGGIRSN